MNSFSPIYFAFMYNERVSFENKATIHFFSFSFRKSFLQSSFRVLDWSLISGLENSPVRYWSRPDTEFLPSYIRYGQADIFFISFHGEYRLAPIHRSRIVNLHKDDVLEPAFVDSVLFEFTEGV